MSVSTEDFEKAVGSFTLYDAVGLAGAAVPPMMGKMTRRPQRILFAVANIRLGMWLPHPRWSPLLRRPPPGARSPALPAMPTTTSQVPTDVTMVAAAKGENSKDVAWHERPLR